MQNYAEVLDAATEQLVLDEIQAEIEPTKEHIREVLDNMEIEPSKDRIKLEDELFWRLK